MRIGSVVLGVAIAAVSSLATWQWAAAQDQARQVLPAMVGGLDISFLWVPAELTASAEAHVVPVR